MKKFITLFWLSFVLSVNAQQPGTVDAAFLPFTGAQANNIHKIIELRDGNILLIGAIKIEGPGYEIDGLCKTDKAGFLDESFVFNKENMEIFDALELPDSTIIILSGDSIFKLNPNGEVNSQFSAISVEDGIQYDLIPSSTERFLFSRRITGESFTTINRYFKNGDIDNSYQISEEVQYMSNASAVPETFNGFFGHGFLKGETSSSICFIDDDGELQYVSDLPMNLLQELQTISDSSFIVSYIDPSNSQKHAIEKVGYGFTILTTREQEFFQRGVYARDSTACVLSLYNETASLIFYNASGERTDSLYLGSSDIYGNIQFSPQTIVIVPDSQSFLYSSSGVLDGLLNGVPISRTHPRFYASRSLYLNNPVFYPSQLVTFDDNRDAFMHYDFEGNLVESKTKVGLSYLPGVDNDFGHIVNGADYKYHRYFNGVLDTTWLDTDGEGLGRVTGSDYDYIYFSEYDFNSSSYITRRVNQSGTVDADFMIEKVVSSSDFLEKIVTTSQNETYVIYVNFFANRYTFSLYNEDGALNETFGEKVLRGDILRAFGDQQGNLIMAITEFGEPEKVFKYNRDGILVDGFPFEGFYDLLGTDLNNNIYVRDFQQEQLIRFTPDGVRDQNFIPGTSSDRLLFDDFYVDSQNRIYLSGPYLHYNGRKTNGLVRLHNDAVSGVAEHEAGGHLMLSPNPSSNFFTVSPQGINGSEEVQLEIHSMDGKKVYRESFEAQDVLRVEHNLPSGLYVVSLSTTERQSELLVVE